MFNRLFHSHSFSEVIPFLPTKFILSVRPSGSKPKVGSLQRVVNFVLPYYRVGFHFYCVGDAAWGWGYIGH